MDHAERAAQRQQHRKELADAVPEFDHFNYQEILDWLAERAEAKVEWINKFWRLKDGVEECFVCDKHALWSLSWEFGVIGLDWWKRDEGEQAKMAAALFMFMHLKGTPASTADKAANAYVRCYFDKITRL